MTKKNNSLISVDAGRDATVEIEGDVVGGDKTAPKEKAAPKITIDWKSLTAPLVAAWGWIVRLVYNIRV